MNEPASRSRTWPRRIFTVVLYLAVLWLVLVLAAHIRDNPEWLKRPFFENSNEQIILFIGVIGFVIWAIRRGGRRD